jgi:hypothetical protein
MPRYRTINDAAKVLPSTADVSSARYAVIGGRHNFETCHFCGVASKGTIHGRNAQGDRIRVCRKPKCIERLEKVR